MPILELASVCFVSTFGEDVTYRAFFFNHRIAKLSENTNGFCCRPQTLKPE